MELFNLSNAEMSSITGGGFFKQLGHIIGYFYDIHFYKGGEAGNWG